MKSILLNLLIRIFAPEVMQRAADAMGSYKTYVLHLPHGTNVGELMHYLFTELPKVPKWHMMTDKPNSEITIKASHDIAVPPNQVLSFRVDKNNIVDTNYARIVHILGETDPELGDKLYIYSHFESAQPIERGKLTAVNDTVIDKIKTYFSPKNFNIDLNITSMERYEDAMTKHDIKVHPVIFFLVIFLVLAFIVYLFTPQFPK